MIAINSVMTASLNRERCRLHVPEVGKKEELDCKDEEAVKELLPQDWEEQDNVGCVEEVVKTEWWSVEENSCDCSLIAKELQEEEEVSALEGSSCETSAEPRWRRQWVEGASDEDDKDESEQPEQVRLLLNVPIRARHSSKDIILAASARHSS